MQQKNYWVNLFNYMYNKIFTNLKCSYVAKIVKITKPTATVQPLAKINNKEQPEVEDVPFLITPSQYQKGNKGLPVTEPKLKYKTGNTVLCVVMNYDDEFFKNKGEFQVASKRKHAIDFSVIVGKIASKSDFA